MRSPLARYDRSLLAGRGKVLFCLLSADNKKAITFADTLAIASKHEQHLLTTLAVRTLPLAKGISTAH